MKTWNLLIAVVVSAMLVAGCGKKKKEEVLQPTGQPLVPARTQADTLVPPQKPEVVKLGTGEMAAGGRFTVQVSSWLTRAEAERDARRFAERGYDVYIQQAYLEKRDQVWFRVRVGSYPTYAEAQLAAQQLSDLLQSGFWVDKIRK